MADVEIVPRDHFGHDEHDGTVELTAAGALVAAEAARDTGVSVAEAGRLRDAPAALLRLGVRR